MFGLANRLGVGTLRSLPAKIRAILKKYGSDAHLYTFGPGVPILGPELVVNGDFSNGTTGWVNVATTVVNGEAMVTADGIAPYVGPTQVVQCVPGKRYSLEVTGRRGTTAGNANLYAAFPNGGSTIVATTFNPTTVNTTAKYTFTASGDGALTITPHIGGSPSPAGTAYFDNITVKEILGYSNTYSGFTAGNYFDSAGTTHASVDGSVGAVLDAAGSVGADLFSEFGVPVSGVTVDNGTRTASFSGSESTWSGVSLSVAPVANKTYRIKISVTLTSGKANLFGGGDAAISGDITASGTYTYHTKASTTGAFGIQSGGVVFNGTVRVDSIQEVTGIHATQSTPGYKPTLRKGIVNLLECGAKIDDDAWWPSTNLSLSPTTVDGLPAAKMTPTTTNGVHRLSRGKPVQNGGKYTAAAVVKAAGYNYFGLKSGVIGADAPVFNLATGALSQGSGTIADLGGGRYLCCHTFTGNADQLWISYWTTLATGDFGAETFAGDGVSGTHIFAGGLFQGTLTAAQILAAGGIPLTTTAPASSLAGPNYLEFDGVDDRLSLPSLGITDACTFVFAITPRAFDTRVIFSSDNAGPQLYLTTGGGLTFDKVGTGTLYSIAAGLQSDVPAVVSVRLSSGLVAIRKNGVAIGSTPSALTFLGTTLHTIGAQSSGGFAYKGLIHLFEAFKVALNDADLILFEKQAAAAAGIQL